jgi:hypothetical protein
LAAIEHLLYLHALDLDGSLLSFGILDEPVEGAPHVTRTFNSDNDAARFGFVQNIFGYDFKNYGESQSSRQFDGFAGSSC